MRMIKILVPVMFLILVIAVPVLAKDTVMDDTTINGINGFDLLSSRIHGNSGLLIGGFTGKHLNDSLLLGSEGYLLITPVPAPAAAQPGVTKPLNIGFFYAGLKCDYNLNPSKVVNFTGELLAGIGYVKYVGTDYDFAVGLASLCCIVEPGINVLVNVSDSLQAGLGVSYRLVSGLNINGLANEDFTGLSMKLVFRFEEF